MFLNRLSGQTRFLKRSDRPNIKIYDRLKKLIVGQTQIFQSLT